MTHSFRSCRSTLGEARACPAKSGTSTTRCLSRHESAYLFPMLSSVSSTHCVQCLFVCTSACQSHCRSLSQAWNTCDGFYASSRTITFTITRTLDHIFFSHHRCLRAGAGCSLRSQRAAPRVHGSGGLEAVRVRQVRKAQGGERLLIDKHCFSQDACDHALQRTFAAATDHKAGSLYTCRGSDSPGLLLPLRSC